MPEPDWIADYFDRMSTWSAQSPRPRNTAQADSLDRLAGPGPLDVLELGCGEGITAALLAGRGHRVTGVDLSAVRLGIAERRAAEVDGPRPRFVHGGFPDTELAAAPFDCVACFNCFGTGSDADQRRLLRRIAGDWLRPGGRAVLDVYSPWRWSKSAGKTTPGHHGIDLVNYNDYDPATGRWLDRWWPVGEPEKAITQYGRAYTPADFALLLDGTGLRIERAELGGEPFDLAAEYGSGSALWGAWDYRVALVHDG